MYEPYFISPSCTNLPHIIPARRHRRARQAVVKTLLYMWPLGPPSWVAVAPSSANSGPLTSTRPGFSNAADCLKISRLACLQCTYLHMYVYVYIYTHIYTCICISLLYICTYVCMHEVQQYIGPSPWGVHFETLRTPFVDRATPHMALRCKANNLLEAPKISRSRTLKLSARGHSQLSQPDAFHLPSMPASRNHSSLSANRNHSKSQKTSIGGTPVYR